MNCSARVSFQALVSGIASLRFRLFLLYFEIACAELSLKQTSTKYLEPRINIEQAVVVHFDFVWPFVHRPN